MTLSDQAVAQFAEQGFLRVDRLTSEIEVRSLCAVYDRLFEPTAAVAAGDRVELATSDDGSRATLPQILNPDHYAPELLDSDAYRGATALARQLLGSEAEYMGMHAIRKPALDGAETPWHQDEAYWDPAYDHPAISVWMPLQPVDEANGCMEFVPGSHRGDVRRHRLAQADADGLVLDDAAAEAGVANAVACPLPAGGATVHAARTLHHAGPNRTAEPRRALIMAFRSPPTLRTDGRAFPWQPARWYA